MSARKPHVSAVSAVSAILALALTAVLPTAACSSAPSASTSAPAVGDAAPDPTAPISVVQAQLDAYNARDIDAFMATFHPQAELFSIGDPTPRASGREAVRAIYADLFERSPGLHSELVNRMVIGNRVLDHERITGREGGEVLEIVMLYEVEDGAIRRAWAIRSPDPSTE